MAPSSFKFYRQGGSQKRSATQCFTGCMTRFPNHLERVLPRKCRPKDTKTRTKDQRMRGPRDQRTKDQRTKGPEDQREQRTEDQGTRGPRHQRTKGPEDQQTKGPEDQGTRGPRDQRTKGRGDQGTRTKGAKDQAIGEPAGQDQRSRGNLLFDTN